MDISPLIKKIRIPTDGNGFLINAPESWKQAFLGVSASFVIESTDQSSWVLAFVKDQEEARNRLQSIAAAVAPGGTLWVAFPKKSGPMSTDMSRDHGWQALEAIDWAPVSNVSLDEEWSALRWKPKGEIPLMKRGTRSADMQVPPALAEALSTEPDAKAYFDSLPPSHRREYIEYIMEAKKEETRARRLLKTMEMLLTKKKNPTA